MAIYEPSLQIIMKITFKFPQHTVWLTRGVVGPNARVVINNCASGYVPLKFSFEMFALKLADGFLSENWHVFIFD